MTGKRIDTVIGPVKILPECKSQAVCVNGSRCWEAGVVQMVWTETPYVLA